VDPETSCCSNSCKPLVRHSFNTVPTEVAYIELDQLVVYQHHIDLTFVQKLKNRLGQSPSEEEIFRACLPCQPSSPPVKWSRTHRNTLFSCRHPTICVFLVPCRWSRRTSRTILPRQSRGCSRLAVGFGSNFLNAIYAEKRLILNNGSHRAYALRDLGITRVPCIVQHISSRDELSVLASTAITDAPNFYLQDPRPMMLKDYSIRDFAK